MNRRFVVGILLAVAVVLAIGMGYIKLPASLRICHEEVRDVPAVPLEERAIAFLEGIGAELADIDVVAEAEVLMVAAKLCEESDEYIIDKVAIWAMETAVVEVFVLDNNVVGRVYVTYVAQLNQDACEFFNGVYGTDFTPDEWIIYAVFTVGEDGAQAIVGWLEGQPKPLDFEDQEWVRKYVEVVQEAGIGYQTAQYPVRFEENPVEVVEPEVRGTE